MRNNKLAQQCFVITSKHVSISAHLHHLFTLHTTQVVFLQLNFSQQQQLFEQVSNSCLKSSSSSSLLSVHFVEIPINHTTSPQLLTTPHHHHYLTLRLFHTLHLSLALHPFDGSASLSSPSPQHLTSSTTLSSSSSSSQLTLVPILKSLFLSPLSLRLGVECLCHPFTRLPSTSPHSTFLLPSASCRDLQVSYTHSFLFSLPRVSSKSY